MAIENEIAESLKAIEAVRATFPDRYKFKTQVRMATAIFTDHTIKPEYPAGERLDKVSARLGPVTVEVRWADHSVVMVEGTEVFSHYHDQAQFTEESAGIDQEAIARAVSRIADGVCERAEAWQVAEKQRLFELEVDKKVALRRKMELANSQMEELA